MRTVIVMLFLTLVSCKGSTASEVAFLTLDKSNYSAIAVEKLSTSRNTVDWNTLWSQHTSNIFPAPVTPVVDFNQQMVIGVFIGQRSNGCYSVAITHVYQKNSNTTVEYHESTPTINSVCTMALTNPAHIISVPTQSGTVQFIKK